MTNWSSIFHSSISLPFSIRRLCNHHEQVSLPSKTGEGDVFFAIKGSRCDGHQFIPEAIKRGAGAIVCEKHPESCGDNQVPHIIVADGAAAWTDANRCQWGNPDHHLKIYGVTGTAGKTTITHAIQQILGHSCGRIGTIDCQWGEHCIASSQTTPRAEYMFQILREMVDDGLREVALEVSSHALMERRAFAMNFQCAVFSNLSHEHLDYHHSMDQYFDAKMRLFDGRNGSIPSHIVINGDDLYGMQLMEILGRKRIPFVTVGTSPPCQWRLLSCRDDEEGTLVHFSYSGRCHVFRSRLVGDFQGMNLLLALAATSPHVPLAQALHCLQQLPPIAGRMQKISTDFGGEIFIDYAHKPSALEAVLQALKRRKNGKIYTLFGCGGNRDREKRLLMAAIAERWSDCSIITADNSRDEPLEDIFRDITAGFREKNFITIPDRRAAIAWAINALRKCGGTLLIAGKGHETTQEFISEKLPFHDASIVAEILQCAEETPMDGNLPQWKMGRNGKGRQRMKILILGEGITGMALKEFCENHGYAHEICRENAHQMDWQNVQCLVYSPGAIHSPLLLFAKKFGLPCLNDLDFAQQFYGNKTIAITGTNGKTSTTLMLCHMLRKLSMSAIATGNIGSPPIAHVDTFRSQKEMWNVCEVSSFQSQHMYQFRPHHSIWTNFAPNHLNMHGDCTKYFTAKQNLLACTKLHTFIGKSVGEFSQKLQINLADGHEIFDAQDTERNYWEESGGVLQFPHQVANFRAVECLLKKLFPAQKIDGNLLRNFTFPAHRLHRCHTFRNVSFWNDSKATNAAAVSAAVAALRPHCDCLLWISSGRSKGEDLENFREIISVVDYAITMGEMGKHFEKYFGQQRVLFFENDSSLCQWIGERLRQNASLSHAILFSPGFTSFDRFRNFEERGEWFVEKICRSFLWEKFC